MAGNDFPKYFVSDSVPVLDAAAARAWRLEVSGAVRHPLSLSLDELMKLPRITQKVDHFCVEGWNARATWSGVRVSDLARLAGATSDAGYVDFAGNLDGSKAAVQALRPFGIDSREVGYIRADGAPETLVALVAQGIDAAVLTVPTDAQALKLGYHYVIYGPDLKIAYAATTITTRRTIIAKRGPVIGRFMRAMAEAAKIMHTDKDLTFKVLGKYLRIDDRALLDASYNVEIKALEPRLALKLDGIQSTLDEIAPTEPRAKTVKPQEMIDSRYLDEMEKSGFFDQIWGRK